MRNRVAENTVEIAHRRIKEMIIQGQLKQGEFLNVLHLMDLLDLGRTPITAACQILHAEGFIKVIPKQGILINPITIADIRDICEARDAIEFYMYERGFDNITSADVEELEKSIMRQVEFCNIGDMPDFWAETVYFRRFMMEKYSNSLLMNTYCNFSDRIFPLVAKISLSPNHMQEFIDNHKRLVECLETHDKQGFLKEITINRICEYSFVTSFASLT